MLIVRLVDKFYMLSDISELFEVLLKNILMRVTEFKRTMNKFW